MAYIFREGFVVPSFLFQSKIVDYLHCQGLDVVLESLDNEILTFGFEELVVPVEIDDVGLGNAGFFGKGLDLD
jgi:hypothetical protein